jgi:hypothetical protein
VSEFGQIEDVFPGLPYENSCCVQSEDLFVNYLVDCCDEICQHEDLFIHYSFVGIVNERVDWHVAVHLSDEPSPINFTNGRVDCRCQINFMTGLTDCHDANCQYGVSCGIHPCDRRCSSSLDIRQFPVLLKTG